MSDKFNLFVNMDVLYSIFFFLNVTNKFQISYHVNNKDISLENLIVEGYVCFQTARGLEKTRTALF